MKKVHIRALKNKYMVLTALGRRVSEVFLSSPDPNKIENKEKVNKPN